MEIHQGQVDFKNGGKKSEKGPFQPKPVYASMKERKGESKRAREKQNKTNTNPPPKKQQQQ